MVKRTLLRRARPWYCAGAVAGSAEAMWLQGVPAVASDTAPPSGWGMVVELVGCVGCLGVGVDGADVMAFSRAWRAAFLCASLDGC